MSVDIILMNTHTRVDHMPYHINIRYQNGRLPSGMTEDDLPQTIAVTAGDENIARDQIEGKEGSLSDDDRPESQKENDLALSVEDIAIIEAMRRNISKSTGAPEDEWMIQFIGHQTLRVEHIPSSRQFAGVIPR